MARIDMPPERLSDYERAVCYYTLPRVVHPVTLGLIAIYAVCVLEALTVVIYGLYTENDHLTRIGVVVFAGIIVFGVIIFMAHGILNEVRQRKALAAAKQLPQAVADLQEEEAASDLPDPFADHVLLRHPLHTRGDLFPCTDNEGNLAYFVESSPTTAWWKVKDPQDKEVIRVHVESASKSFSLGSDVPSRLVVYEGVQEVARIRRRFSFTATNVHIDSVKPAPAHYVLRQTGIYRDKRVVGRVYYLHQSLYLDVERAEFNPGILGLFITMT